jgi:hypothetical protein
MQECLDIRRASGQSSITFGDRQRASVTSTELRSEAIQGDGLGVSGPEQNTMPAK